MTKRRNDQWSYELWPWDAGHFGVCYEKHSDDTLISEPSELFSVMRKMSSMTIIWRSSLNRPKITTEKLSSLSRLKCVRRRTDDAWTGFSRDTFRGFLTQAASTLPLVFHLKSGFIRLKILQWGKCRLLLFLVILWLALGTLHTSSPPCSGCQGWTWSVHRQQPFYFCSV